MASGGTSGNDHPNGANEESPQLNPRTVDAAADSSGVAAAVLPERLVVRLLVVLTAAAGSLDMVCVTKLGGLYASVVTGNLVQLARGIATVDGRFALAATTAVGCYGLGVAAGSAGVGFRTVGWRRRTSLIAAAELALLGCVAAGWAATGGRPDASITLLLLALATSAMGVQSALTISSGPRGSSTTYLTGTLTHLVRNLTSKPHRSAVAFGGARLAALLCGAVACAVLLQVVPLWAPALPVVLVGAVMVIAATRPALASGSLHPEV